MRFVSSLRFLFIKYIQKYSDVYHRFVVYCTNYRNELYFIYVLPSPCFNRQFIICSPEFTKRDRISTIVWLFVCLFEIVLNATFNNISAISWRSVLLGEETGGLAEKPPTCRKSLTNFIT